MLTLTGFGWTSASGAPEFNLRTAIEGMGPVGWVVVGILLLMSQDYLLDTGSCFCYAVLVWT